MAVEFLLLLAPVDIQLAGVRGLADPRRAAVGLGLFDPQPAEIRFDFRDTGAGGPFAFACGSEPRSRRLDEPGQLTIAPGEQYLLPAPQLVAQALVTPGLRRLPLQRATLLFHFEHDVVDAGQI